MLSVFNTLTRRKELFKPIKPGKVGLYVCGMTVYDYCHIGHARVMVVFDIMTRYLRSQGYEVTYVRNITDIDDKIIHRAQEMNIEMNELTARFIEAMNEDAARLGIIKPTHEPRATEYVDGMIELISTLQSKGYAYVSDHGDVCYSVAKFKDYGCLSHKDLEGLRAGARVEVERGKQDPLDFVLWKMAKPGEPSWSSPWGEGRPGWHTECCVMSMNLLGEHFDLHGGGMDLQFPHHENEIAQCSAARDTKFVNNWLHVGFVQIDNEKMSKSLNNFFTIREVLACYPPEVIRYFMAASHYRSPLNYSTDALDNAKAGLARMYLALREVPACDELLADETYTQAFQAAMNDDFNTPVAMSVLFDLVRELNIEKEKPSTSKRAGQLATLLRTLSTTLGILQLTPEAFLQMGAGGLSEPEILDLIDKRIAARAEKQWQEADRIRQKLLDDNIVIEDHPQGTRWRRIG